MAEDEAREQLAQGLPDERELPDHDWLTAEEACDWLRVDKPVLYRAAQAGQLPALKIGREWRVHRQLLVAQARGEWKPAAAD